MRQQSLQDCIRRQKSLGGLSPLCGVSVGIARADSPSLESGPTSATGGAPTAASASQLEPDPRAAGNFPPAKSRGRKRRPTANKAVVAEIDTSKEPKRALTVDEAARLYSISRSSIYNLIKNKVLPDVVVAGRRLLPRDAMEALIIGNK